MRKANTKLTVLLTVIAICLFKIAFLSDENQNTGIIPSAHASGVAAWDQKNLRMVTSSIDGATTYVWDYEHQTTVRKYSIENSKLVLTSYHLDNDDEK